MDLIEDIFCGLMMALASIGAFHIAYNLRWGFKDTLTFKSAMMLVIVLWVLSSLFLWFLYSAEKKGDVNGKENEGVVRA